MSANSIYVKGDTESQITDLALYIAKLRGEDGDMDAPYVKEIQSIYKDKKDAVYTQLAKDASIFLTENNKQVEGAFNLLVVLVLQAPEAVLKDAVFTLIDTLTKTESSKIGLKQKILLNLYNALPNDSTLRYNAFIALIEVTAQADELDSLIGQLEYVDTWAKQWGIGKETERHLYQYLDEVLLNAGEEKLSLKFALRNLSTFEARDEKSKKIAKDVIIRAIAMDNYFAFEDLLQYPAVQQLKEDKNSEEYALLDVFLNGNLSTYQEFVKSHPNAVKLCPSPENNLHKMRLLSLASLGSENLSRELKYADIAANLQISEDEVEMWVIDVIRAGLVEAKLDQLNKTVLVHRSIYRVFGTEQWKKLSTCLNAWKNNLNEILTVIGNAKLIAGGNTAAVTSAIENNANANQ
ncbi:hypothetical protein BDF20DRAFT_916369 [Mycotypha africana]|uniref:uncharacterized protein n=1 Tax=Mycotypha africana TaxID=64632 RepID=UPI0022FFF2AA|nr:uncharacterized protein BDF20DRAFT_916369 [Mycotypha africana]KAI8968942.1 hypothetical protein BDF20DRAFT_916369 [Mycotypha africana]